MQEEQYLADSQIILQFLKGQTELYDIFNDTENLSISKISIGELYAVAEQHRENKLIMDTVRSFVNLLTIRDVDENTISCFGKIKAEVYKKKLNASDNHLWIAAVAMAGNLCLITMNPFYKQLDGLKVKLIEI